MNMKIIAIGTKLGIMVRTDCQRDRHNQAIIRKIISTEPPMLETCPPTSNSSMSANRRPRPAISHFVSVLTCSPSQVRISSMTAVMSLALCTFRLRLTRATRRSSSRKSPSSSPSYMNRNWLMSSGSSGSAPVLAGSSSWNPQFISLMKSIGDMALSTSRQRLGPVLECTDLLELRRIEQTVGLLGLEYHVQWCGAHEARIDEIGALPVRMGRCEIFLHAGFDVDIPDLRQSHRQQ